MKKMKKQRILGYVLAVCLLLSNVLVMDVPMASAAASTKVYFLNAEKWDNVYGYVWDNSGDSGQSLGAWPGTKAEKSSIGTDWYQISVPDDSDFHIIMNNGVRSDGKESQYDTYVEKGGNSIYVSTEAKDGNKIFSSKEAAELAMGYSDDSTVVYFKNSKGWTNIYGYAYRDGKDVDAAWPGKAASAASEKGENWYKVVVPLNASDTPFGMIFTDGSAKAEVWISNENNVYVTPAGEVFSNSADADKATAGDRIDEEAANPDLDDMVPLSGVGADLSYTTYEAETASTNAEVMTSKRTYRTDIQSEASGRQAVKLTDTGDYVEFTLKKPANAMVLRYSIPDSSDGAGQDASLNLYVNDKQKQSLNVTSKYAWIYGSYPYTNNPGDGQAHRFFDEIRVKFDETFAAGTKIRLQKDSANTAKNYIIDFIECEEVAKAISKPSNSLSITDYGAVANDGKDDAAAIKSCIDAAKSQGKIVWIPDGNFTVSKKEAFQVADVTIQGAGMWYSVLEGAGASFGYQGTCRFFDFAMTGVSTIRKDDEDLAGFEGVGTATNITIENIWMEHMKVGIWSYNTKGMVVQGCRIRNTYADGINMSAGTNQSVVRSNNLRNTGDDCIAIWPNKANGSNNTIEYNTVQIPTLANGIAVYGGSGNAVQYNYVADTVANGAGICFGTMFETISGFTGSFTIKGNTLKRCGSWHCDYNYPVGAVWFCGSNEPMTAEYNVSDNEIFDSSYPGIMFECWRNVSGVTISNTNIYGATDGIYVRGNQKSSITVKNVGVCELTGKQTNIENSEFTLTKQDKGIYTTTRPKEEPEVDVQDLPLLALEGELAKLSGGAAMPEVAGAFNGGYIGNVGGPDNGTATFTVYAEEASTRLLKIFYSVDGERQLNVVVNGTKTITLNCSGTDWEKPNAQPAATAITLSAGQNTIQLTGVNGAYAPNIDRIEIGLTDAEAQKMVQTLIDELPAATSVTAADKLKINAVKLSYDALKNKDNVTSDKLNAALTKLEELENGGNIGETETEPGGNTGESETNPGGNTGESETNPGGNTGETETESGGNTGETETEPGGNIGPDKPCTHAIKVTKNKKDATCKEAGYTGDLYCKNCNTKLESGTSIAKPTHNWDAGKVTKPASETADGEKTFTCTVCGEQKKEAIAAIKNNQKNEPAAGTVLVDSATGMKYKVLSSNEKKRTAELSGLTNKSVKTIKIPAQVTLNGIKYSVTTIGKNAFKGCPKLQSVEIGKKVEKIGAKAFYGCKKLKKITIKTSRLKLKNVGKKAFAKIYKKAVVKVPKKKVKAYKTLLVKRGMNKAAKIKK